VCVGVCVCVQEGGVSGIPGLESGCEMRLSRTYLINLATESWPTLMGTPLTV